MCVGVEGQSGVNLANAGDVKERLSGIEGMQASSVCPELAKLATHNYSIIGQEGLNEILSKIPKGTKGIDSNTVLFAVAEHAQYFQDNKLIGRICTIIKGMGRGERVSQFLAVQALQEAHGVTENHTVYKEAEKILTAIHRDDLPWLYPPRKPGEDWLDIP